MCSRSSLGTRTTPDQLNRPGQADRMKHRNHDMPTFNSNNSNHTNASGQTNSRNPVAGVPGSIHTPRSHKKIGEILVKRGVLTQTQCQRVLDEQTRCHRPFGELAEVMFCVPPKALEDAWAEQYESVTAHVDPRTERVDPTVLMQLTRRQAWQFRLVPLRMDGSELLICTCREHLPRAVRFAYQHFGTGCYFVLTDKEKLAEALSMYYPMDGAAAVMHACDEAKRCAAGDTSDP